MPIQVGQRVAAHLARTPVETFEIFLTQEMLDKIVIHTNEEGKGVFDKWNEENPT